MVERSRWAEWIGREVAVSDAIDPVRAEALQATLGTHAGPYRRGQPLPPLWHWAYFWEIASRDRLGPDGHARRGDFLPPIELPRRMWAGSRLRFVGDLVPGKEARRISAVDSVTEKQGRSGPLVFVTVHHRILVGDTLAVEEEQDLVYRGEQHRWCGKAFGPRTRRPGVAERGGTRSRPAVPILCAYLQRPPHPLRPWLRGRSGGLSGTRGARTAPGDAHAGTGQAESAGPANRRIRLPGRRTDLRYRFLPGRRPSGR